MDLFESEEVKQLVFKIATGLIEYSLSYNLYDIVFSTSWNILFPDGTPVAIRSMYLVGPPPKLSRNKVIARRQQFINSQIAPIEEDCVVPVDNPELRDDDGDKLKNDADELKNDVSGELKTDETEEKIKEESAPLDTADTEDFTLDVNAESMEDFKADDFKEGEFATDEFACDNYADDPNFDNFAQDSTVHDDPEGLNIGDIKEEDLEDF